MSKVTGMTKEEDGANRRDFLKLAATTAPAAAIVAATSGGAAKANAPDLSSEKMQDTDHTRAYFDSARF